MASVVTFDRTAMSPSIVSIAIVLALFPTTALADFSGSAVSVLDGDTIEVLHNQHPERIRLNGIDCPEKGQAFGKRAKQAVSELVFGKDVTLQTYGKDKYGRTIADVLLADGTNVNQVLVKEGWCWSYRKYAAGDAELERLEHEAKEAKKGLWQDTAPVPPWLYRKTRREQALDLSDLIPLDTPPTSEGTPRAPPALGAIELDLSRSRLLIIGNRKSHIYHRPDCPSYSQVLPRNRVPFNSAAEAEEAGYRMAKNCP